MRRNKTSRVQVKLILNSILMQMRKEKNSVRARKVSHGVKMDRIYFQVSGETSRGSHAVAHANTPAHSYSCTNSLCGCALEITTQTLWPPRRSSVSSQVNTDFWELAFSPGYFFLLFVCISSIPDPHGRITSLHVNPGSTSRLQL